MKQRWRAALIITTTMCVLAAAGFVALTEFPSDVEVVKARDEHVHGDERIWTVDIPGAEPLHFGEKGAVTVCGLLDHGPILTFAQLDEWRWSPEAAVAIMASSAENTCPEHADLDFQGVPAAAARMGASLPLLEGVTVGKTYAGCGVWFWTDIVFAKIFTLSKACAKFKITAWWPVPGGHWFRTKTINGPDYRGTVYSAVGDLPLCFADFWFWAYGSGGVGWRYWNSGGVLYLGGTN